VSISIEWRQAGAVAILDLSGESTIMDGSVLQQTVRRLTREGYRLFVLNLQNLRHLDSFGLGQFVSTYIGVRDQKGEIKIVNPSPTVKDLLRYSRIDSVLQVLGSEEEAVQELQKLAAK
jgi:anti-anti-sigma factor